MLPYLKGQKVFDYIDGTIQQPAKTITASDGSTIPNPSFANWETQDNLILTCIDSSLSDEVLAQITHYSTSTEVWIALSTAFASQSRAKTIQVHSQLSTLNSLLCGKEVKP
jgi:hypothetical protein